MGVLIAIVVIAAVLLLLSKLGDMAGEEHPVLFLICIIASAGVTMIAIRAAQGSGRYP